MIKSAYVHVPFCRSICAYCDFARIIYQENLIEPWMSQIRKETQGKLSAPLDTLYLGGGTPNALSHEQLDSFLSIFDPYLRKRMEYTIEINPELLDEEMVNICVNHGINRVSMGVQSFDDHLLRIMNRRHCGKDIRQKINLFIEKGIRNISIDLIYGLPKQSLEMWMNDLQQAISLPIQHISLYSLTIEENSAFGKRGIQKADDDLEYTMYNNAIRFLQANGFQQYEIANFAKEGAFSKHNLTYWLYEDFAGIGCGASGKTKEGRYDNTRSLTHYLKEGPCPTWTMLSVEEQMFETIMMGLRLRKGISLQAFEECYHRSLFEQFKSAIQKHLGNDLVIEEGYLRTTEQGMFLLHDLLIDFL